MENNRNLPEKKDKPENKQKFMPNNRYFTISIYVLIVITAATLIIRVVMTPHSVSGALRVILDMLMPFIIGVLIALILNPIIGRLVQILSGPCRIKSLKLCKIIATVLSYLCVLGIITICILFIVPQVVKSLTELINSLPQLYQVTYDFFDTLQERFPSVDVSEIQKMVNDILPNIIDTLRDFASNLVPALYSASISIVKWLINMIIAIIVSVYMLVDEKSLKRSIKLLLYSFVPENSIAATINILRECHNIFTNFLVGKAIDSLIIGILCFILMSIFNLDYSLLISVIVGITNMIPYFGPFIGAVPGVLVLLMISPLKAFGFTALIVVLQQFDGLYLGPKIMGNTVGLKPLWIIVSITIGGSIGGVLGMFLSVPLVAILGYLLGLLVNFRLKKKHINPENL